MKLKIKNKREFVECVYWLSNEHDYMKNKQTKKCGEHKLNYMITSPQSNLTTIINK